MEEGGRTPTASPRPPISPRLAAALVAVQSWVDVPDNILVRVSAFLPCRADRVHMAYVNRHWRAAVTGLRRPPPPVLPPLPDLPPQLPWLIFNSTEPPTFYSVLGRSYHRLYGLPLDVRAARCVGSCDGGWLVLAFKEPHVYALYNLNSGERIPLPQGFRSRFNNAEFPLVVHAATLSASPSNGPYVVAAIGRMGNRPVAAFWSQGDESWFSTGALLTVMPQDVIYYAGAFYFVTPEEELIVFQTAHGPNGHVILGREDLDMRQRAGYDLDVISMRDDDVGRMKLYLVESDQGELLMVVRFVFNEGLGTDFHRVLVLSESAPTTNVQRPPWTWEQLYKPDLDGLMLFLGRGCSRSFEVARYNGFMESTIYFLDESFPVPPPVDDDDDDDAAALEVDDDDDDDAAAPDDDDDDDAAAPDDDDDGDAAAADDMGSVHSDNPDMGGYSVARMESNNSWPPGPRPRSDVPPTWWLH